MIFEIYKTLAERSPCLIRHSRLLVYDTVRRSLSADEKTRLRSGNNTSSRSCLRNGTEVLIEDLETMGRSKLCKKENKFIGRVSGGVGEWEKEGVRERDVAAKLRGSSLVFQLNMSRLSEKQHFGQRAFPLFSNSVSILVLSRRQRSERYNGFHIQFLEIVGPIALVFEACSVFSAVEPRSCVFGHVSFFLLSTHNKRVHGCFSVCPFDLILWPSYVSFLSSLQFRRGASSVRSCNLCSVIARFFIRGKWIRECRDYRIRWRAIAAFITLCHIFEKWLIFAASMPVGSPAVGSELPGVPNKSNRRSSERISYSVFYKSRKSPCNNPI